MPIADRISSALSGVALTLQSSTENAEQALLVFRARWESTPTASLVTGFLDWIVSKGDKVSVTFEEPDLVDACTLSNNSDVNDWIADVHSGYREVQSFEVTVRISKPAAAVTNIYLLDSFCDFIESMSAESGWNYLRSRIKEGREQYLLLGTKGVLRTESLCFGDVPSHAQIPHDGSSAKPTPECRRGLCHITGMVDLHAAPDDFWVVERSGDVDRLADIFDRWSAVLCVCYLAHRCEFKGDTMIASILGLKAYESTFDLKNYRPSGTQVMYDVYRWVYLSDANMESRIGISRNVLSLHLSDLKDPWSPEILYAIKANYSVYLQGQTERFIEMAAAASEQLLQMQEGLRRMLASVLSDYRTNVVLLISFVITSILATRITADSTQIVLSAEMRIIVVTISLISLLHCFSSIRSWNQNTKVLIERWRNVRTRYEILVGKEAEKLLFSAKDDLDNIRTSDRRQIAVNAAIWISTLVLLFDMAVTQLAAPLFLKLFRYLGSWLGVVH